MNSTPADVDVSAQWHCRDTLGAMRRTVIINNSLCREGGCFCVFVCHAVVFVHYMCMTECGFVFCQRKYIVCGVSRYRMVTLLSKKV